MIIRELKLENIRSYTSGTIRFPEGSVLLSGDVGSGKSTILLSIDFALFGLQKHLSGASLLRHGEEHGSVELVFEIDGVEYVIKRTLRRKRGSVRQEAAQIIFNGRKRELTAQEAKSFVLGLLGYPKQALRQDSALLYRYTVYTPQEQMRQIIESDINERLDLIRRLFGIDKYKRISENASIFARELRSKIRELSASISGINEKREELKEISKSEEEERGRVSLIRAELEKRQEEMKAKQKELEEVEKRIEELNKKREEYAVLKAEHDSLLAQIKKQGADLEDLRNRLSEVREQLSSIHLPKGLSRDAISSLEKDLHLIVSEIAVLDSEVKSLSEILEKGVCGTCKQRVADPEAFRSGIEKKMERLDTLRKREAEIRRSLESMRGYIELEQRHRLLLERRSELEEIRGRYESELEEKKKRRRDIAQRANKLAEEIKREDISNLKALRDQFEKLREVVEELRGKLLVAEQKIRDLSERRRGLEKEVAEMEKTAEKVDAYTRYEHWIVDFFANLMATIERHVMLSVQYEFNSLFQKWFSLLVTDETLSARIDDNFSVVIEQNGFETHYSFMSGGERTAIALAYRLALNRVINDLIERIKTKDLLVLDEPTDGFSSEQMDSVRDILSELRTRQTILVSHEPKIESFVDKTIRIVKEDGISRVVSRPVLYHFLLYERGTKKRAQDRQEPQGKITKRDENGNRSPKDPSCGNKCVTASSEENPKEPGDNAAEAVGQRSEVATIFYP